MQYGACNVSVKVITCKILVFSGKHLIMISSNCFSVLLRGHSLTLTAASYCTFNLPYSKQAAVVASVNVKHLQQNRGFSSNTAVMG